MPTRVSLEELLSDLSLAVVVKWWESLLPTTRWSLSSSHRCVWYEVVVVVSASDWLRFDGVFEEVDEEDDDDLDEDDVDA